MRTIPIDTQIGRVTYKGNDYGIEICCFRNVMRNHIITDMNLICQPVKTCLRQTTSDNIISVDPDATWERWCPLDTLGGSHDDTWQEGQNNGEIHAARKIQSMLNKSLGK